MKVVDPAMLSGLAADAAASTRRRKNLNLHAGQDDPVQRFLNAIEPGSYVRPHRHADDRWELVALLRGRGRVVLFEADGTVIASLPLDGDHPLVEVPGGTWHSVVAFEAGTLLLEIKQGPYEPTSDKDFAGWAPPEGGPGAAELQRWIAAAAAGQRP